MIEKSLSRLKKLDELFISKGYKPLVLFSGGKDSLVVLDLCHQYFGSDMYVAYIHIPGNTHETCDYYVLCTVEKYLGSLSRFMYLYQNKPLKVRNKLMDPDFFEYAMEYGIPTFRNARWCMRIFKIEVLKKLPRNFIFISGEKSSDSTFRFKFMTKHTREGLVLPTIANADYHVNINLKLIWDWSKDVVWKYIRERELKLNPLYGTIGHSGNCMLCPCYLTSVDRILRYLHRLELYDKRWYDKILNFFREYMRKHRELTRCSVKCSKCPYMKDKNKYVFAKRIGVVLELLNGNNCILNYLKFSK